MRKKHISWLIGWLGLSVIVGVWLSRYYTDIFASAGWLITGLILFGVAAINRRPAAIVLAILAGLLIGLSRGSLGQVDLKAYQPFIDQQVTARGIVAEDTAFGASGDQRLKIKNVEIEGASLPGEVWLSTTSLAEIKRSDRIEISGRLSEGFGNFPAAIYKADLRKVERVENADIARDIRDKFADAIRRLVGEPEASLGIGYLVGQRTALPEDLTEKLRILGLTHIIVASGYNLTILIRFSRKIFARVSKYLTILVGFLLTFSFVLVTGLSPSMTRAGLVTGLSLLAWYFGRNIHPLVLLPLAASVTALINPSYVWGDLGWYLSFAAFGGVMILSPLLVHYFWGADRPNSILQIVFETVSAQAATMPIIALAFGQYAPLAVISNLLILPLVALAMIATFLAGVAALVFGLSLPWFGWPAEAILGYMTWVVDSLAQLPIAIAEVSFGIPALITSYTVLAMVCLYIYRRTRHDFSEDSIID